MRKIFIVSLLVALFAYAALASSFSRSHAELQATARHLNALEKKLRAELQRANQLLTSRRNTLNKASAARNRAHQAARNALNARNSARTAFNNANAARTRAHQAASKALSQRNTANKNFNAAVSARNQAHARYSSAVRARNTANNNFNNARTRLTRANSAYSSAVKTRSQADRTFVSARNALNNARRHRDNVKNVVTRELALIAQLRRIIGAQHHQSTIRCGDRVRLQGAHGGRFLTATRTGCRHGSNQGCANFSPRQAASVWTITCSAAQNRAKTQVTRNMKIGFRSVFGRWLAAESSGCRGHGGRQGCLNANRPWFKSWEHFAVQTTGGASHVQSGAQIGLRSHHNLFVVHESNHHANANRPWFKGWEHLRITKA